MCSRNSGFGIGYGIGRNYRPIRVSVSVSDRNQNSGFSRSLHSLVQSRLCPTGIPPTIPKSKYGAKSADVLAGPDAHWPPTCQGGGRSELRGRCQEGREGQRLSGLKPTTFATLREHFWRPSHHRRASYQWPTINGGAWETAWRTAASMPPA